MATAGPRSIGSIETWQPPDKSFSKHILTEGRGDSMPNDGSVCTVNLSLVGADEIAEEKLGGYTFGCDVEITVGEGDTLISELLDKVVCSMKEGEVCYIKSKIDSQGNTVSEFDMTSKSSLKFNAQLKDMNRAADCSELEPDERLEKAQHHKDKGSELFKLNRLDFAMKRYEKALTFLLSMESVSELPKILSEQYTTLKCQCYLNLAASHLKKDKFSEVVQQCSNALELDPKNVKGLFRRGQAHLKLNDYDAAKADFQRALQIEPENKAISNQIITVESLIKKEKDVYKKMFS